MDATCKVQNGIHLLSLGHKSMCPGNWVHISEAPLVSMSVFPQKSQNTLRQTGLASRQRASSTRFLYLRSRAFPRDTLWLALPRATDPSGDELSVLQKSDALRGERIPERAPSSGAVCVPERESVARGHTRRSRGQRRVTRPRGKSARTGPGAEGSAGMRALGEGRASRGASGVSRGASGGSCDVVSDVV